jgi:MscS family membrane protein
LLHDFDRYTNAQRFGICRGQSACRLILPVQSEIWGPEAAVWRFALSDFLTSRYEFLAAWLLNLNWHQIIAALLVVIAVMIARRYIARLALKFVRAVGAHFHIQLATRLGNALQPGLELFIFSLGLLAALEISRPPGQLGDILESLAISMIVASVFFTIYHCTPLAASILQNRSNERTAIDVDWIGNILKVVTVVLGLASVLKVWGIELGSLFTGVGIAGAAAAFAAQDLLKNLIGGMSNTAERRFEIGDWVRAEGVVEGIVEKVALRSTAIRQFDMSLVHIPNSDLANAPLINVSRMQNRRIYLSIQLLQRTSTEQLRNIISGIKKTIVENDQISQPPDATQYVCIESINFKSVDIMVYCFTKSTLYADYINVREGLLFEIKRLVEESGAQFAHDIRTLYVDDTDAFARSMIAREGPDVSQV